MIGMKGWTQRSLSGKPFAEHKGLQPNTSEPSTQDQYKLRKGIFILTLGVKQASGVSKIVHSEVTYSTGH